MKACTKCYDIKSYDCFYKHKRRGDGYRSFCKECMKKENNEYIEKNKKKVRKYNNEYIKNNRGIVNASRAIKRAGKAVPPYLTDKEKRKIRDLYVKCHEIQKKTGIPMEVDHKIPRNGKNVSGLHILSNLRIVTKKENRKKGNKLLKKFTRTRKKK